MQQEIKVAAIALLNTDHKILLTERPEGKIMAGYWEFPGGKLEADEDFKSAAIRELYEELNLKARQQDLAFIGEFKQPQPETRKLIHLKLYLCKDWTGTLINRDGQAWAWLHPDQFKDYDIIPSNEPLLPLIGRKL